MKTMVEYGVAFLLQMQEDMENIEIYSLHPSVNAREMVSMFAENFLKIRQASVSVWTGPQSQVLGPMVKTDY